MNVNPNTLDTLAVGLALGAIVMRMTERPYWASLMGSVSLLFSTVAQALSRGRQVKPWS